MVTGEIATEELWRDITRLTGNSSRECVRSLRIALFISLQSVSPETGLKPLGKLVSGILSLLPFRTDGPARPEKGKLVFCFAHNTPSNMSNLLPVARDALRRGQMGGIIAAKDFPQLKEFSSAIPIVTPDALVSRLALKERCQIASEALSAFREISRMLSDYNALYASRFRRNAFIMLDFLIRSLEIEKGVRYLLDEWQPSAVISTSDLWPFEYQIAVAASSRKILSAVIQHGSLIYFYWPFAADLNLLWGEESFDEMLNLGAPADRLAIGGMPSSDKRFDRVSVRQTPARKEGKLPVCLILSHTHAREMEQEVFTNYKHFLNKLIPSTPFVQWRIKLHPSESRSFYEDMDAGITEKLEFHPPTTTLEDALKEADVVTTLYSTAGLEAMMTGLPLIVPIVSRRMTESGLLPQIKGALQVYTPEEFSQELMLLISDPEHRNRRLASQAAYLNRSFANQGRASTAILDLLNERLTPMQLSDLK